MSVRMALAKLCACTCGGAILGGGAVHVAENPPQRPHFVKYAKAKPRTVAHRPKARALSRVRKVARTACVVSQPGTTTTTRTITYPGGMAAIPLPPVPPVGFGGSGGGGVTVVGGSGGFGSGFGGGFFSGGFFGGSSSG